MNKDGGPVEWKTVFEGLGKLSNISAIKPKHGKYLLKATKSAVINELQYRFREKSSHSLHTLQTVIGGKRTARSKYVGADPNLSHRAD